MIGQPPTLNVRGLTKRFLAAGPAVVDNLSFQVAPGELLAVVGPSGCGKTTLLRLIAGFERADAGAIDLDGEPIARSGQGSPRLHVAPERRRVGVVFQDFSLFPHMTVLGNVMFGLDGRRRLRRAQAMDVLAMLAMAELAHRKPHALSGGQQQRVALARALAPRPRFLLLDEPFSNLDPALREAACGDVKRLLNELGTSAILVTHDRDEALSFGPRLAVMSDGAIEQIGPPEDVYRAPATEFVARFLGRATLLRAAGAGPNATTSLGLVTPSRAVLGDATLAVRPEQFRLVAPDASPVRGVVQECAFRGAFQALTVQVDRELVSVVADCQQIWHVGEAVGVAIVGPVAVVRGADRVVESGAENGG